ncbi:MAG TPA: hypothetical protein VLF89_02940 [Candidatus Saccharimonadales bacterium]|nr:hypothetical protein [Candidatus Saccharimonadales bacterium]
MLNERELFRGFTILKSNNKELPPSQPQIEPIILIDGDATEDWEGPTKLVAPEDPPDLTEETILPSWRSQERGLSLVQRYRAEAIFARSLHSRFVVTAREHLPRIQTRDPLLDEQGYVRRLFDAYVNKSVNGDMAAVAEYDPLEQYFTSQIDGMWETIEDDRTTIFLTASQFNPTDGNNFYRGIKSIIGEHIEANLVHWLRSQEPELTDKEILRKYELIFSDAYFAKKTDHQAEFMADHGILGEPYMTQMEFMYERFEELRRKYIPPEQESNYLNPSKNLTTDSSELQKAVKEWGITISAHAGEYILRDVGFAVVAGLATTMEHNLNHFADNLDMTTFVIGSYLFWMYGIKKKLDANWDSLEKRGISTNAVSKALYNTVASLAENLRETLGNLVIKSREEAEGKRNNVYELSNNYYELALAEENVVKLQRFVSDAPYAGGEALLEIPWILGVLKGGDLAHLSLNEKLLYLMVATQIAGGYEAVSANVLKPKTNGKNGN